MEKKNYFEPETKEVIVAMEAALLTGSDGEQIPQGGGEGEETPGGW